MLRGGPGGFTQTCWWLVAAWLGFKSGYVDNLMRVIHMFRALLACTSGVDSKSVVFVVSLTLLGGNPYWCGLLFV